MGLGLLEAIASAAPRSLSLFRRGALAFGAFLDPRAPSIASSLWCRAATSSTAVGAARISPTHVIECITRHRPQVSSALIPTTSLSILNLLSCMSGMKISLDKKQHRHASTLPILVCSAHVLTFANNLSHLLFESGSIIPPHDCCIQVCWTLVIGIVEHGNDRH